MSSQNGNLETSYLLLYAHVYSPDIGSSQCAAAVIILKPVLRLHDQVKLIQLKTVDMIKSFFINMR